MIRGRRQLRDNGRGRQRSGECRSQRPGSLPDFGRWSVGDENPRSLARGLPRVRRADVDLDFLTQSVQEAEEAVEKARKQIARLIKADSKEIVFTSGATEADNLALKGVLEMYKEKGNHIITSATEHRAVLDTAHWLANGIISFIHTIDPDAVILGGAMNFGGPTNPLGREFLQRIRDQVRPRLLEPLRDKASALAGAEIAHALIARYDPGAGIGWHKDRGVFDRVVGISLLSPAVLRFRKRTASGFTRFNMPLEPRSAYLLSGTARYDWEHRIVPGEQLRFSITFRTMSDIGRRKAAAAQRSS